MEKDQKPEILDQSTQSFGLQVMKKNGGEAGESSRESTAEIRMETEHLTVSGDNITEEKETPKTLEEQALEAVIKGIYICISNARAGRKCGEKSV